MQVLYSMKAAILLYACSTLTTLAIAQSPTIVNPSAGCGFVRDFNTSDEGFSSPSIYSGDDDVSFFWNASAGALIDSSGISNRQGSLISPIYPNTLNGQTIVGFTYSAPAGTEYRIRIITGAASEILATTANGPVWTPLPSTSGTLCLQLIDADLTFGALIRYEFSFRVNPPQDVVFDNFALSAANIPLPVTFLGFVARKNDDGTLKLLWNVGDEINADHYEVESSINGYNFSTIGTVSAEGKSNYSFDYPEEITETKFFRIKNVDRDGQFKYSGVIKVSGREKNGQLQLYPVPANDQVYVQHGKAPARAMITIVSVEGKVVKQVSPIPNTLQTSLNIHDLRTGIYFIKYEDGSGNTQSARLIRN